MAGAPTRAMKDTKSTNNETSRQRRQHSAADKVRLLRLHLVEGKAISAIFEEHGIHPTLFYQWQKTFFENGAAAFSSPRTETKSSAAERTIESLQARVKRKDEVIAEIMEDFIRTKKELGES